MRHEQGSVDYILDNLAIGSFGDALAPPSEINALLCVAQEKDIQKPGVLYHKVPIVDMQPIPPQQLREAVEWIGDHIGDHRIMVFCNAGVGRSPSSVVAYLCVVGGHSFGSAVEFVASRKPYMSILPNLIKSIEDVKRALQAGT